MDVCFTRHWAMPNKQTFSIKPINELLVNTIQQYNESIFLPKRKERILLNDYPDRIYVVDPFAGNPTTLKQILIEAVGENGYYWWTNDLNEEHQTHCHVDALSFLGNEVGGETVDIMIFDPPYSPRQITECYKRIGIKATKEDTQSRFWSDCKDEIARIMKYNGIVICCGWNSNGMGINRGFKLIGGAIIAHGGNHNDTIITIERKE